MADPSPSAFLPLRVLVLDDEATIRTTLALCLETAGHQVVACGTGQEALAANAGQVFDLLFLDVRLGIENGLDFLPQFLRQSPWLKVIVITAYASIDTAVEAMRRGALDYLPKPFTPEHVEALAKKVAESRAVELRLRELSERMDASAPPLLLESANHDVQAAMTLARTLAQGKFALLLQGEGGAGKRTLARMIHEWSPRQAGPYMVSTAQGRDEAQLGLELFGAEGDERSRLEHCSGGTLYVDDLCALSPRLQLKLLEVIGQGSLEREGSYNRVPVDVRIIAGSNRPLAALTDAGLFRQDLFYAFSAKCVELPALRQRMEDFPNFVETFLAFYARQNGKAFTGLTAEAMDYLKGYGWPGNLRELRNVLERAVLLATPRGASAAIGIDSLPANLRAKDSPAHLGDLVALEQIEELHIRGVLEATQSLESAARILGIDYATLWRRRKKYGLQAMAETSEHPRFFSGLTRKLLAGFGGVMLVLLVVSGLLIAFLTSHSSALEAVQHENYDSVRYCDGMKNALDRAQAIAQMNGPAAQDAAAALEKARADFEAGAQAQLRNLTLPGEKERSQAAVQAGRAVFDKTRALLGDASIADRATYYRDQIFPAYQQCRSSLADVSQMNLRNLVKVDHEVGEALLAIRTTIIMLLAIGLALSCTFVLLTARGNYHPLMQLTRSVRKMETGDLDQIVEAYSDDEIGQLAAAFNEMAAKLREFRKMDMELLARTRQTTQIAIDSLPDAVVVLNIKGQIEMANRTAQVHFKLMPGVDIHAVRPQWAASYFDPVLKTAASVKPDGYRSAIQLFDDSGERFLLPRAEPIFDFGHQLIGVTLILVEITHLRKADEFKSGLLSAASHELKTPLTSIRMAMRMLQDKRIGELNPRQATLLSAAEIDSERLVHTVEDILTIGRVEAGRTRLERSTAGADEIARRALDTVEHAAAERHITLDARLPSPVPRMYVDVNLLACALSNLLSNAIKYSGYGSTVKLLVETADGSAKFKVQDHGPGIPDQFRKRIFEKFFRIPTAGGPTGAGLGLSIADEITKLHDGTLELADTSAQGSTFELRIPLAPQ